MGSADIVAPMAVRLLQDSACSLLHVEDRPCGWRVEVLAESSRTCCLRVRIDYAGPAAAAAPAVELKSSHLWCNTQLSCSGKACRVVPAAAPQARGRLVTRSTCQVWRRTLLGRWVPAAPGSRAYAAHLLDRRPPAPADLAMQWQDRAPHRVITDIPGLTSG